MNSFLLSLATLLIVAILTLFAAPFFIDWNGYKPEFEREASRILGRKVSVEGKIHLTVLPTPRIRLDGVKVADGPDGGAALLEAKSFVARVSLTPLLGGTVEAQSIEIDQPTLRLRVAEDGSGNWKWQGGRLPRVMPNAVSLESVVIKEGTVEIAKSDGSGFKLEQVNGDLTARALTGPFSFNGTFSRDGEPREVRLSTGPLDDDGGVRLKSTLRDPPRGLTYQLDGQLAGISGKPSFTGNFIARAAPEHTEDEQLTRALPKDPPFELKAAASLDANKAELTNMEVTLRRGPQTHNLKGAVAIDLGRTMKVGGEINARLIDLDMLLNVPLGAAPYAALEMLVARLTALAGGLDVSDFRIAFDQASLAGDLIKDLTVRLGSDAKGVRLDALSADLPGDTAIEASGLLGSTDGSPDFRGHVALHGDNLRSLVRWATASASILPQAETGAFKLAGDVEARRNLIALSNAEGEAKGAGFHGALRYETGEKRVFDLTLNSDRLDLTPFLDGPVTLRPLFASLSQSAPAGAPVEGSPNGFLQLIASAETRLEISVGELVAPGLPKGKLEAEMTYSNDTVDVRRLNFASGDVLSVHADGKLEKTSETPRGKVTVALKAGTAEGAEAITTLLAVPDEVATYERIVRMAPLDLAATLEARDDAAGAAAKLTIGGAMGGANLSVNGSFAGKLKDAESGAVTADATLSAPSPQIALGLLFPKVAKESLSAAGPSSASLRLNASGRWSEPLTVRAALDAQKARFAYEGKASLKNGLMLDGHVSTALDDAALALALAGLPAGPDATGAAVTLSAALAGGGDVFAVKEVTGSIGGKPVGGAASIDLKGAKPALDLTLAAPFVSMPAAFSSILLWDRQTAETAKADVDRADRVWPSQPFAFDGLKSLDLKLAVKADNLRLTPEMSVQNARLSATVKDGSLGFDGLQGKLFGGELDAKGVLAARGGVGALTTSIVLKNARLESFTETVAGRPLASGGFDFHAEGNGEGLSLSGIAASLSGKGEIGVRHGTVKNLSPEALQQVDAEMTAAARTPDSADQLLRLTRSLPERLTSGAFDFESTKAPFEVRNGMVRLDKVVLRNDASEVSAKLFLELVNLELDSQWTVGLRGSGGAEAAPPVNLVVAGPLAQARTITASVETDGLERYLTMRSMEQDVERLERLDVTGTGPPEPGTAKSPEQPQGDALQAVEPAPRPVKPKAPRASRNAQRRAPRAPAPPPSASDLLPWAPIVAPPSSRTPSARRRGPISPPVDAFAAPPG